MKQPIRKTLLALAIAIAGSPAWAQTCQTADEIPRPVRTALETAAGKTFEQASFGDVDAMQANIAPSAQSIFAGMAAAVKDNKAALVGTTPQLRISFLLDTGATPSPEGKFYCGVFGAAGATANAAEFDLPGLPAGKYGLVIQDLVSSKGPYALTTIYQDAGGWKLAGFWIRPETALGHDGLWYLRRAREYKSKGQLHNAWFYYVTSWDLMAPVTFMDSNLLAKITEESNKTQPKDVPVAGNTVNYSANGKTYKITEMNAFRTEDELDLLIKYSVASTQDTAAVQIDARKLADAVVAQYPELKDAFNNVWVRAVDPAGGVAVGLLKLKP
jgi:hypothetical protein